MKDNRNRKKAYFRLANISAVLIVILSTFIHISAELFKDSSGGFNIFLMGIINGAALILLFISFKMTRNYRELAVFVPLIVLAASTLNEALSNGALGWNEYYLGLCIACCVMSCLYDNLIYAIVFVCLENIALSIMVFAETPFMGPGSKTKAIYILDPEVYQGIPILGFGLFISIIAGVFLLVVFWYLTDRANRANEKQDSFRTLMDTTPNYIAMVDELNRVTNVSKNLAKLAHLENPDWAIGRPLLDLFPTIELKEMAGGLLRKNIGLYEEMWEFYLNGEHHYFKALGDDLPEGKGILINLIDMTHLAERDEIAAMKDSLKIGLFFMDKDSIIQNNYSKAMHWMLGLDEFDNVKFSDILAPSVTPSELQAIEDYFGMLFEQQFDQAILNDINPLDEFHYTNPKTKEHQILHVGFIAVERGRGEIMIMGSIYDITQKIELQKRLAEEEKIRQEEMRSLFELINVDPQVFNVFIEDAEYEFKQIDDILKNSEFSVHEMLVETYKSVHAIKSNAVILGLATFGDKVHALESRIKKMRETEDVSFDDILKLTLDIEKLSQEKEKFSVTLSRINSVRSNAKQKSNEDVLIESLMRATEKASEDLQKKVQFVVDSIDSGIMERGPRRVIKEVLMQLVRNSVVHGVEAPEVRLAKGKAETGVIHLAIKQEDNMIHIRLRDDGGGINFARIGEKALANGFCKDEEEAKDKNKLLLAIFSPGFSTAESETVHGGRGIGLNIVRDKVNELGGSLKVQTEQDKGTAFHLYIPFIDNDQQKEDS
jgi:two-component system chemotaxis sensor kinase CheA